MGLRVYDRRDFEERRGFNINQWGRVGLILFGLLLA